MELTDTAYLILGALAERPRSGYDIKRFADMATRHFWAISYGQLYPELRRLSAAGLVEAEPGGPRHRTVWRITPAGREALEEWVDDPADHPLELRDGMLVRLFFSDVAGPETRLELARRLAARHRATRDGLEGKRRQLAAVPGEAPMHQEVLRLGVDLNDFLTGWYEDLARRLAGEEEAR
jgi:PadR family transcriptional regulator AphA